MKTITKTFTIYTIEELKEKFPKSFEKVYHNFVRNFDYDSSDIWGSFNKICEAIGWKGVLELRNYTTHLDNADKREGKSRRIAWIENNIKYSFRVYNGSLKNCSKEMKNKKKCYRGGVFPDCAFTGYYSDNILFNEFCESFINGSSILQSLRDMKAEAHKLIEEDIDNQTSEEAFIECCDDNFTEEGQIVYE